MRIRNIEFPVLLRKIFDHLELSRKNKFFLGRKKVLPFFIKHDQMSMSIHPDTRLDVDFVQKCRHWHRFCCRFIKQEKILMLMSRQRNVDRHRHLMSFYKISSSIPVSRRLCEVAKQSLKRSHLVNIGWGDVPM